MSLNNFNISIIFSIKKFINNSVTRKNVGFIPQKSISISQQKDFVTFKSHFSTFVPIALTGVTRLSKIKCLSIVLYFYFIYFCLNKADYFLFLLKGIAVQWDVSVYLNNVNYIVRVCIFQLDSGGPMVWGNTLQGLVSWGWGCARTLHPGVFTDLSSPAIRGWILNQINI